MQNRPLRVFSTMRSQYTTPSKIVKVYECPRMAAWDIVDPLPYEQGDQAKLGDEVHAILDVYVTQGMAPDPTTVPGLLAQSALPYAPRALRGRPEEKHWVTLGGVRWSMRRDWVGSTEDLPGYTGETVPVTIDYKTTGNPSRGIWGKEQHLRDIPAIVYAKARLAEVRDDVVLNRWIYINTKLKKPKAGPSDALLARAEVDQAFEERVLPGARLHLAMQSAHARRALDVFALPPNPHRCMLYAKADGSNACPRIHQCNLPASLQMAAANGEVTLDMSQSTIDPLMDLLARAQAKPAPVISVNPAPAPVALAAPAPVALAPAAAPAPVAIAPSGDLTAEECLTLVTLLRRVLHG